jgi:ketosteroid isomerase-like protein
MTTWTQEQADDVNELHRLNADYIASDQGSDVACYERFLAPDFTATLPDLVFRDRAQFLDLISQPRPFLDLTAHDVTIRILGDVALMHGRVTYTTISDRADRQALYTDTYQRRDGRWLCIAANVTARGE